MSKIFRYRLITNLQCNNRCRFCYQTYKPTIGTDIVVDINKVEDTMKKVFIKKGKLYRTTIMGGESLLLKNICEYVELAKRYADIVCIVTNGTLLTEQLLLDLNDSGLDELAISIHSINNFNCMYEKLLLANKVIKNMRINIPRCEDSSNETLKTLVYKCLDNDFGCVVCEDLMGRYGNPHTEIISKWDNVIEVKNEFNFITYKDIEKNKVFGLFAHYTGYNDTDIIITPIGNFSNWETYCNKLGNYDLH